jgi:hypothetical protein
MSERRENDNYQTPAWCVDALLRNVVGLSTARDILEPCAGNGAILREMEGRWCMRGSRFTSVEIREEEHEPLSLLADEVHIADFLTWKPTGKYDLILTNPPYCIALEVAKKCLSLAGPDTTVALLLRLGFLQAQERIPFWQAHPLSGLYVLGARPSFTGDSGRDNSGYGWFIWRGTQAPLYQEIQVIDSPTRPRKKR